MAVKIVKFKNGKYAIRRGNCLTGYEYLHNEHLNINWWSRAYIIFAYMNDLSTAQKRLENYNTSIGVLVDYGTPV